MPKKVMITVLIWSDTECDFCRDIARVTDPPWRACDEHFEHLKAVLEEDGVDPKEAFVEPED